MKRAISFDAQGFSKPELLSIYKSLLKPRMIEEKMLVLLRQGKITKWFSGWGQEAISVGTTLAMKEEEYILPMHRNLGVFTTREIPLNRLFSQFQGKQNGFTKGRDRSFHFGTQDHRIVGMISHLGPQLGIADGIALANILKQEELATLVFTGDGGASEGDFHESLNVAAVWNLPVIFCVENNSWGLSTPSEEQFKCKQFIDKGVGYGMEAIQMDGNNILEVIRTLRKITKEIRKNPKPVLLEAMTFRVRGHEESSGTKYYPEGIQEEWAIKDPLSNYEMFLKEEGILTDKIESEYRNELKEHIQSSFDIAQNEPLITSDEDKEENDVFAPHIQNVIEAQGGEKRN